MIDSVNRGGYAVIATGEIKAGDAERLRNIFIGKESFPVTTRIKTQGGSVEAAMALGELYRAANLSVIAAEGCDTSCFLWLVGGVSRAVSGNVLLEREALDRSDVEEYLQSMDIVSASMSELLGKEPSGHLTVAQFDARIGERPRSFINWLKDSCSSMSDQEREDFRLLQAKGFLDSLQRLQKEGRAGPNVEALIEKYRTLAARASELSPAYEAALTQQWMEMNRCRQTVLLDAQENFLAGLDQ